MTTASRALTWLATNTAGPVRDWSCSRSRTSRLQKLLRAGKSRLDWSAARILRMPRVRAHPAVSTACVSNVGTSVCRIGRGSGLPPKTSDRPDYPNFWSSKAPDSPAYPGVSHTDRAASDCWAVEASRVIATDLNALNHEMHTLA